MSEWPVSDEKLEPSQLELGIPAEPSMYPLHSQRLSQAKREKLVQLTQESMMNTRPIVTGSVESGYGKASLTGEEKEKHRVLVEEASKLPGLIYTTFSSIENLQKLFAEPI